MSNSQGPSVFIKRWQDSGAGERANYQLFLSELCDLFDVPRPDPAVPDDAKNNYVFERAITFRHADGSTSAGRIDLYKRACFVCETKQGSQAKRADDPARLHGMLVRPPCAPAEQFLRYRLSGRVGVIPNL